MAQTVVGLFRSVGEADTAARQLREAGFGPERVSIVGRGRVGDDESSSNPVAAGAGMGAAGGALLGGAAGLLAGIGVLVVPGIGPLLAVGPIVAILTGAGAGAAVGAAAGSLTGALIVAGVPESSARKYTERIRAGGTLVAVTAEDDRADAAAELLTQCGAGEVARHERPAPAIPGRSAAGAAADDPPARPADSADDHLEREFRRHFDSGAREDRSRPGERRYEDFRPAYKYGAELSQEMYGRNFDLAVWQVRQRWEAQHPGTWDRYQHAIRYGWERGRPQP